MINLIKLKKIIFDKLKNNNFFLIFNNNILVSLLISILYIQIVMFKKIQN
jgi:hypothetical protein